MIKNKLLATSIVVFGMFYSAEGMKGLPSLWLEYQSTNPVSQSETVSRVEFNGNVVNLVDKLDETFNALQDCFDEYGENSEKASNILVKEFQDLKERLLQANDSQQQRGAIIREYRQFILEVRSAGFFGNDCYIINAFTKAGLEPFKGLGNELLLSTPNKYCMFIASRYFNTLEDHMNCALAARRLNSNMEDFFYNPISVDENTKRFFPRLETLHVYDENDRYLEGGKIQRYVDSCSRSFREVLQIRRENSSKKIEFKKVTLDDKNFKSLLRKNERDLIKNCIITLSEGTTTCSFLNNFYIENIKKIDLQKFEEVYDVKITKLEDFCFCICHSLKEITLPETLEEIGAHCFESCATLPRIEIPKSLTKLEYGCFEECGSLKEIMLPNSLKEIDSECFASCCKLTGIAIPEEVTKLGYHCFYCCNLLEEITLPNTLKIGRVCFNWCKELKRVIIKGKEVTIEGNKTKAIYKIRTCANPTKQVRRKIDLFNKKQKQSDPSDPMTKK